MLKTVKDSIWVLLRFRGRTDRSSWKGLAVVNEILFMSWLEDAPETLWTCLAGNGCQYWNLLDYPRKYTGKVRCRKFTKGTITKERKKVHKVGVDSLHTTCIEWMKRRAHKWVYKIGYHPKAQSYRFWILILDQCLPPIELDALRLEGLLRISPSPFSGNLPLVQACETESLVRLLADPRIWGFNGFIRKNSKSDPKLLVNWRIVNPNSSL